MLNYSAICVDANLVVQLATNTGDARIQELWKRWQMEQRRIVAPTLIRYEAANAFHRYARAGMLTAEEVREALAIALTAPIRLFDDVGLHAKALALATRFALPAAYDAHYLALAEEEQAEFWTTDQRLANTVGDTLSWVHLAYFVTRAYAFWANLTPQPPLHRVARGSIIAMARPSATHHGASDEAPLSTPMERRAPAGQEG